MKKIVQRFVSSLLVVLILSATALAFSFGSNHINTTTIIGPPSGSLQLEGSIPQNLIINTTSISSLTLKNAANVDISGIYLNLTITETDVNYTTVTVQIAGENTWVTCGVGACWFLSDRTWMLYAGTSMTIDISLNFHRLGQYGISVWAYGQGG